MKNTETADLTITGRGSLERSNLKPEEEVETSIYSDMKICCPCGSSLPTESMIQVNCYFCFIAR
jgi:hypothetical protein